jgi:hypothetical protein
MRAILLLVLFPTICLAEQVRLDVGASSTATKETLRKILATDITPNQEIVGSKGEWPVRGLYWAAHDFKIIFEIADQSLCYWTEEDFGVSKMHRENSRRYARSILFDTEKKSFTVLKKSRWKFWR